MNFTETGIFQQQKVSIKSLLPEIGIEQARQEIIEGLIAERSFISSKFFYDATGSILFEEITKLDEYYPTRTEKGILAEIAFDLMNRKSSFEIIELGSGDCSKISILLNAVKQQNLENLKYIPVDFSRSAIEDSANELSERFPGIEINGYVADFIHQTHVIPHTGIPRMICFLGSTIGNFPKKEAKEIVLSLSKELLDGDSLLIGFDLVKPEHILHAAYNDSKGVTEKFNKNILSVVNEIVKSDFKLTNFDHLSYFNRERSRIEMHLVANKNCTVNSPFLNKPLEFKEGDSIHTENSHKYTLQTIEELIDEAGLAIRYSYVDSRKWFALVEFERNF
jgi:L-histidine N-alpha-methyltransferase